MNQSVWLRLSVPSASNATGNYQRGYHKKLHIIPPTQNFQQHVTLCSAWRSICSESVSFQHSIGIYGIAQHPGHSRYHIHISLRSGTGVRGSPFPPSSGMIVFTLFHAGKAHGAAVQHDTIFLSILVINTYTLLTTFNVNLQSGMS